MVIIDLSKSRLLLGVTPSQISVTPMMLRWAGVLHAILIVFLCVLALYDSPELMSSSNFFQVPESGWAWGLDDCPLNSG